MSKWCGKIGYGCAEETNPGVYVEKIIERFYYGDVIKNVKSSESGDSLNDNININNNMSIVADAYAYQNFHLMKYVTYMGARWKVKSVEVQRPRLLLSIGGVYNGPTPETSGEPGESTGS